MKRLIVGTIAVWAFTIASIAQTIEVQKVGSADVKTVDGKGNIVWQHNGYLEGDEEHLFEVLKQVAKGEKIKE